MKIIIIVIINIRSLWYKFDAIVWSREISFHLFLFSDTLELGKKGGWVYFSCRERETSADTDQASKKHDRSDRRQRYYDLRGSVGRASSSWMVSRLSHVFRHCQQNQSKFPGGGQGGHVELLEIACNTLYFRLYASASCVVNRSKLI